MIVLNNNTDIKALADRLITAIRAAGFSASIGIAKFKIGDTAARLFKRADKKCYEVKEAGRDRYII